MKTALLLTLTLLLVTACAGLQGMIAHASASGTGDARTDGDTLVVVGDIGANLGVRTATGIPVLLIPPVPLARDEWYVSSSSRGFEARNPMTTPLPWWTRSLYTDPELASLREMGVTIVFEDPPTPDG